MNKMKTKELILALIIVGYLLAIFSFLAFQNSIVFENNKDRPMQMIKLDMICNTAITTSYEIESPHSNANASTIAFQAIMGAALRMGFALPFVIGGLGLIGGPMALITNNFVLPPEAYRGMVFWICNVFYVKLKFLYNTTLLE